MIECNDKINVNIVEKKEKIMKKYAIIAGMMLLTINLRTLPKWKTPKWVKKAAKSVKKTAGEAFQPVEVLFKTRIIHKNKTGKTMDYKVTCIKFLEEYVISRRNNVKPGKQITLKTRTTHCHVHSTKLQGKKSGSKDWEDVKDLD